LAHHGDAEKWKRFGDLILANLATAERRGDKTIVTDFFDENLPVIEIEAEENLSATRRPETPTKKFLNASKSSNRNWKI
jgi:hypothetical protein